MLLNGDDYEQVNVNIIGFSEMLQCVQKEWKDKTKVELKNRKSMGTDEMHAEMIKELLNVGVWLLLKICCEGCVPENWKVYIRIIINSECDKINWLRMIKRWFWCSRRCVDQIFAMRQSKDKTWVKGKGLTWPSGI